MWDKMIGVASTPLCGVPYANEASDGFWLRLFTENALNSQSSHNFVTATNHELLIDLRFETGADLTLEEVLQMQDQFDSVWRFDGLDHVQLIEDDNLRNQFSQFL